MKIAFLEIEKWEVLILKEKMKKEELFFSTEAIGSRIISKIKDYEVLSVFIHSKLGKEELGRLPKLKLIVTRSTGFEHIDLAECRRRGIKVGNVPSYGENTVAEHTFALILGLSRKLIDCVERTRKGSFELKGLRGFDLKGKTLGVVGCGKIGEHVARIGKGLEMKVLVFDVKKDLKLAKRLGFRYTGMDKLLKEADIVSLHVPLNKYTYHLINGEKIKKMKKGAILINTARGGIVETEALVRGLKSGHLGGAGLDVLEEEGELAEERELLTKKFEEKGDLKILVENHILLGMPNVLITPHNAFNTKEALERILEVTVENIKGWKKGKRANWVN